MNNNDFPVYPNEAGYVEVPNGWYLCKKFKDYGEPLEEIVNIYDGYLPSHYEYVIHPVTYIEQKEIK